jgi:hypothetical protein
MICRRFIELGEYTLRLTVEKGKGVIDIHDDLDQMNILSFYEAGWPSRFMMFSEKHKDYVLYPAVDFAHFIVGTDAERVNVRNMLENVYGTSSMAVYYSRLSKEVLDKLPDYTRVGTPLFYRLIGKLRELELHEQLIPASKLNQLSQSTFVAIGMPATTAPVEAVAKIQQIEQMLNVPSGIDYSRQQVSLGEIMTVAGKIKCVPDFSNGQGKMEPLNLRQNQAVDDLLNNARDLRELLCSSLGVPAERIYGRRPDQQVQGPDLRMEMRYMRKLADFQESISHGFRQLGLTHLVNRGHRPKYTDVNCRFLQRLGDISVLEKFEMDDAKMTTLTNLLTFIATLDPSITPDLAKTIDKKEMIGWMQSKISLLCDGIKVFRDPDEMSSTDLQDMFGPNTQVSPDLSVAGGEPNLPGMEPAPGGGGGSEAPSAPPTIPGVTGQPGANLVGGAG